MLRSFILSLALATGLGTTSVLAEDITLRMATAAPPNTIWQEQFDQFAADVAEETAGEVKIEIFYNAQLGGEHAVLPQVMRGRIDMGAFSVASLTDQMSEAYFVSLLYFYDDLNVRSCVLDNISADFREMIAPTGLHFMDWLEVGSGQLSGSKPFTTPDSVKGLRIGVAGNPLSNLYWEMLDSYPVMTSSADASSSISTGLVDVYPTIPVFYLFAGIAQVAPVITKMDYVLSPGVLVINQGVWDRLSEENRSGIERAMARHPAAECSAAFFAFEDKIYEMHKQKGGTVVIPTAEERAQWAVNIDSYYEKILEMTSPEGRAFFEKLSTIRDNCKK